jgi:teichuronic acid biosynthesis glycosyltransferase TuaG
MNELVSVITPSYNSEEFISATIESILAQSYPYLELIIIDDASSDNTRMILNSYKDADSRIILIFLDVNGGSGIARNKGIEVAKGKYLAFVDSDDLWHVDKLKSQINFMQESGLSFTYTKYSFISESGELVKASNVAPNQCNYFRLLLQNCIGCSTVMIDSEKLGKEYMPSLRNRQDWGLWLKYVRKSKKAHGLGYPFTNYRIKKGSISSNKLKLFKFHWQIYYEIENYNFVISCLLFTLNILTISYYTLLNKILVKGKR